MRKSPHSARVMPKYWSPEILFHSWNSTNPTAIVLTVSKESMEPELTATPSLEVVRPKAIKTSGEITKIASSQRENLSSPFAQTALTELARRAIRTAPTIYSQTGRFLIIGPTVQEFLPLEKGLSPKLFLCYNIYMNHKNTTSEYLGELATMRLSFILVGAIVLLGLGLFLGVAVDRIIMGEHFPHFTVNKIPAGGSYAHGRVIFPN